MAVWYQKSVAMAAESKFKSPHCLQSDRKECWAVSLSALLPEAAGSQDPQVFPPPPQHPPLPPTPAEYPHFAPAAPRSPRPRWFPPLPDQTGRSLWNVSALIHTSRQPAIIPRRCRASVKSVLVCVVRVSKPGLVLYTSLSSLGLTANLLRPLLCISAMLPVNIWTHIITVLQVLFIYFANLIAHPTDCPLNNLRCRFFVLF